MKMSNRSLKSIKVMLDVTVLGTDRPVSLAEISQRNGISVSYLEVMFRQLRSHDLIRSTRGPGGGYRLNRDCSAISIADIVSAVEEDQLAAGAALPPGLTANAVSLVTTRLWRGLDDYLSDYLHTITLASLIETAHENRPTNQPSRMPRRPSARQVPSEIMHGDALTMA